MLQGDTYLCGLPIADSTRAACVVKVRPPNILKLTGMARVEGKIGMVSLDMGDGTLSSYTKRIRWYDRLRIESLTSTGV
jgi:hypothetical protein